MQAPDENKLPDRTFTHPDGSVTLPGMNVYDIRWRNFRALIGGGRHGAITDAAKRLQKSQGQVSHFGGAKPIKNIGHILAREIEAAWGHPEGWLDREHFTEDAPNHPESITSGGLQLPSQPVTLAPETLAEAEKWVRFEEASAGKELPPIPRAERIIALCALILADGGMALAPLHAQELIDAARARQSGGSHDRRTERSRAAS